MNGLQSITLSGLGILLVLVAILTYRKPTIVLNETVVSRNSAGAVEMAAPGPVFTHEELQTALNAIACSRDLYWNVYCTTFYKGEPENYQATATVGKAFNIYIEEGATAYWNVYSGFKTQDEAAQALLKALSGPPNSLPQHKKEHVQVRFPPWEGAPTSCP